MSFPHHDNRQSDRPVHPPAAPKNEHAEALGILPLKKPCESCGDAGVWRGIDGFTFICTECSFELT